MSIAKRIHEFLDVSEIFLRLSRDGLFNDGLSSQEELGRVRLPRLRDGQPLWSRPDDQLDYPKQECNHAGECKFH